MGKNIIQQARGKGGPRYKSPSFRFKGKIRTLNTTTPGKVVDIINCPGHHAPLMVVEHENKESTLMVAPEGIRVGTRINNTDIARGCVLNLKDIPTGIPIHNIESAPGDGGKFCRSSGGAAKIIAKTEKTITVQLPSKKKKTFNPQCRASIGLIAGSGRPEKPLLKAGKAHHKKKARNKLYPRSSASAMNAVDHPYGNKRTSRKAKQKSTSKFAPPGAKVGKLWPKRTGRKK